MLIAVSWAYLLQQQVDPNDECPGDHCWILVVVLAANMLAGVLYIPAVSLALVRRLGRSDRVLFELEAHTGTRRGLSFRRAVTRRLQRLATDASATCWSVTASSFVYFTLKQLEFVASGGDSSNFVRPVEHAGDTAARRHLIHHRFAVLSACFGVCLGVVCVSLVTMILATRKLATETRPLFLEVWLLLRSGLYYSCAFAIATFIGLLFFSPFELDWGGKVVRLFAALARAFGLVVLARSIVRRLPVPPSDDSIAFAEASTHWTACANLFCFNVSSVVAAIGIHDAVVFFLVDVLSLSRWRRIAVLFTYAIALISFVLRRRTLEAKRRAEMDPASCNHLAEFRSCNSPSDLAFLNVLERWLVCFAWWVPYKYFFVEAWDVLGVRGTPPSRS
ncbi:hypothetical protein CTAYLR_000855 [Chrysophaeum taylorii]|uniref:Uncharacterized protein n=1 Tax=Chrysophaeum taylorii TaxID=2483200 RepID=A0AAD7XNT8_9STRA|nr:hypothetical protein CTAYLR_000855 [Chrysophaeum taylorii]